MIATAIHHKPIGKLLGDRGLSARDLLEALPAAVYLTDAAGHLTFYNRAAADLWGWCPDPGSTRWCGSWRLFWPDGTSLPHEQCPMAVAIQQNRQVRGAEAVAERPDGTRVPFAPYPTPLRDPDGELIGAVNLLLDVSEGWGDEAARHRRPPARLLHEETERRANNLLMAILPIAGMVREDTAAPRRPPKGRARALALRLMDESGLGNGPDPQPPTGLRARTDSLTPGLAALGRISARCRSWDIRPRAPIEQNRDRPPLPPPPFFFPFPRTVEAVVA